MNKLVILAAAALIGAAGLASAQDTLATADAFGTIPVQEDNQLIVLPLVTATADGEVQIRRITGENEGEVLATAPITAGANEDVRITLIRPANASAVLAVLVVGGVDVASAEVQLAPVGGTD
ncbi:hypothetical protein [Rubellimicrobium aerolatum]|uniref:Uncharacterized protein n=1 Tax=Rubellimicrobium aerolatum TaxID=490979 RepID=A0ABW0SAR4_9RHOB|nr:hypothetical protein [Rubellimicrobium aerolatum]MBP1805320.1 hypothetical protein [Rubellimicrobium aerolatum]